MIFFPVSTRSSVFEMAIAYCSVSILWTFDDLREADGSLHSFPRLPLKRDYIFSRVNPICRSSQMA